MDSMTVNGKAFEVIRLLGKGKGGYSYLVRDGEKQYVLKQIHHEPCAYYTFGNKIESEMRDYETLKKIGIRMPKLLSVDTTSERILKEYIDGDTIYQMVKDGKDVSAYQLQLKEMCDQLYPASINIDYFPTNFIPQDGILYYIDYECNGYMEEWNFENWGIKYWSQTEEFLAYVREHS